MCLLCRALASTRKRRSVTAESGRAEEKSCVAAASALTILYGPPLCYY